MLEDIERRGFLLTCCVTPVGLDEVRCLGIRHKAPPTQRESSFLDGGFRPKSFVRETQPVLGFARERTHLGALPFGCLARFPGDEIFFVRGIAVNVRLNRMEAKRTTIISSTATSKNGDPTATLCICMALRQPSERPQAPYHDTVPIPLSFSKMSLSIASRTVCYLHGPHRILPDASSFAVPVDADVNRPVPRVSDPRQSREQPHRIPLSRPRRPRPAF